MEWSEKLLHISKVMCLCFLFIHVKNNCFVYISFCRINPYGLVEIVEVIVDHITDKKEAIEFLGKIKDKVKICDEAVWYVQVSL